MDVALLVVVVFAFELDVDDFFVVDELFLLLVVGFDVGTVVVFSLVTVSTIRTWVLPLNDMNCKVAHD